MPYTVKLPPVTSTHLLSEKPVTAATSGFALGAHTSQTVHTHHGDTGFDVEAVSHLLAMPLREFARKGQLLEVSVPWLSVTLWFVPTEADGERLALEGIGRGRIWTARELDDLLSCAGLKPDQAKVVALAKIEFDGTIVEVVRSGMSV
jgi:hypothetical protein